jgi:hypothetical protein
MLHYTLPLIYFASHYYAIDFRRHTPRLAASCRISPFFFAVSALA